MEYKHIAFNPHMKNLQNVCDEAGKEWALSHIVTVQMYEWVAVFEKDSD